MSSILLISVLDAARSLGVEPSRATPESVAHWLISEYTRRSGGGFNYDPAVGVTFDLFRGAHTLDSAVLHCLTNGNPKGRRQNADAVRTIAPYALANISTCYRIGRTAVVVGRARGENVYVAIKAPLVRVVHDEAFVVMPGYRMTYRPAEPEIDVACSVALATFGRDDFESADFEYLYCGPGVDGHRSFRSIRGRDRRVYDRDEVDAFLDVYVKGVALALNAGLEVKRPDLRGYHIIDPNEPTFPW
jgi:hypothetical protein